MKETTFEEIEHIRKKVQKIGIAVLDECVVHNSIEVVSVERNKFFQDSIVYVGDHVVGLFSDRELMLFEFLRINGWNWEDIKSLNKMIKI